MDTTKQKNGVMMNNDGKPFYFSNLVYLKKKQRKAFSELGTSEQMMGHWIIPVLTT